MSQDEDSALKHLVLGSINHVSHIRISQCVLDSALTHSSLKYEWISVSGEKQEELKAGTRYNSYLFSGWAIVCVKHSCTC